MIAILAGSFLYGDDKKLVYLGAYSIARTPVTNAQYKAFVDATGAKADRYWVRGIILPGMENLPV